jgi:hypothetical protein
MPGFDTELRSKMLVLPEKESHLARQHILGYTIRVLYRAKITQMKHILKTNASKSFVRTSAGPKNEQSAPPSNTASVRRKFSLSSLTSTAPRTADDVRRAFAQGRFAELKPEQA